MTKKVIIFGAGISGLTTAHELINKGFDVTIYEKTSDIGGFAISKRDSSGMPTEHSWRGYAPFYENFFNLVKTIPYDDKTTVYEQLTRPIDFILPKDDLKKRKSLKPSFSFFDVIILAYFGLKVLTSNLRNNYYSKINFSNLLTNILSEGGKDYILKMLGPGLGFDQYITSLFHAMLFVQLQMTDHSHKHKFKHTHGHEHTEEEWVHSSFDNWHVMRQPTNESWFNPWVKYLKQKGLKIIFNQSLYKININQKEVVSCSLDNGEKVIGDYYVFAINPFYLDQIIDGTPELKKDNELNKIKKLVQDGPNDMIGFRIAFDESINLPNDNTVIAFPDSEFNITLYPQERLFDSDVYLGQNIKGLWSGTVCSANFPGKLYGKPANKLSKQELKNEILHQIYRCEQLKDVVKRFNNKKLEDFNIINLEIWHEWKFGQSGEKVKNNNPKWVNTTNTYQYRPNQKTSFNNLFLSGAHTKVSVNIWSMEGAVESGKITAREISKLDSIWLYTHKKPLIFKIISYIDDLLYILKLPNIVDSTFMIIIFFIIKKFFYEA